MRLYSKAKSAIEPFAFEKYRKEKVRQQIEAARPSRLQVKTNLPKINQELALKLMEDKKSIKKKRTKEENLLDDNRFSAMFENADFQVDKHAEEYRLLAPVLTRLDKSKVKKLKKEIQADASNGKAPKANEESTDEDFFSEKEEEEGEQDEDTSDDEKPWAKEVKKEFKKIGREKRRELETVEMQTTDEFKIGDMKKKHSRKSLGDRLASEARPEVEMIGGLGDRQMTFSTEKPKREDKRRQEDMRKHREERKKVRRSVQSLNLKRLNVI
jgi:ribosome biogenesis protein ENP2